MAQNKPDEIEFGHVCETPEDWEQRFEKINLQDKQHQGKVLLHCLKNLFTFTHLLLYLFRPNFLLYLLLTLLSITF